MPSTDTTPVAALHVLPEFGLPYAPAGVTDAGQCTATCPVCGHVAVGATSKDAGRAYGRHFTRLAAKDAE